MLLFKKKFLAAIRAGEKTQTVRIWKRRLMRTGQRSYIPNIGYVHVELVEAVELDDLTDADALPDGFSSAANLRKELARIYEKKESEEWQPYRVRFAVLPPAEQARITLERKLEKAAADEASAPQVDSP